MYESYEQNPTFKQLILILFLVLEIQNDLLKAEKLLNNFFNNSKLAVTNIIYKGRSLDLFANNVIDLQIGLGSEMGKIYSFSDQAPQFFGFSSKVEFK